MDDQSILELLWNRSEAAIDALMQQFGPRLTRMACNYLGQEDAEECVNDTYMAVWNAIPPRRPDPLTPFILRVGRNLALNRLRSLSTQKRSGYVLSLEELSGCIAAPSCTGRELGQAMTGFLVKQSQENRVMFLRRYWFGDSVKEIARTFSMSENAVSVRLSRLRDGLRCHLIKEGYDL